MDPTEFLLYEKFRKDFYRGQRVRKMRMLQHMSQSAMARRLEIDSTHLCAMERGRRAIPEKMAEKMAKVLNVHPSVIMYGDEEERQLDTQDNLPTNE